MDKQKRNFTYYKRNKRVILCYRYIKYSIQNENKYNRQSEKNIP